LADDGLNFSSSKGAASTIALVTMFVLRALILPSNRPNAPSLRNVYLLLAPVSHEFKCIIVNRNNAIRYVKSTSKGYDDKTSNDKEFTGIDATVVTVCTSEWRA